MFEWAALGGVVFALFIFCARIMRRGLSSLDDVRRQHTEKINEGKRRLAEDCKKISADDQFHLLEAAIEDLVRLRPEAGAWKTEKRDRIIALENPPRRWEIELVMRERVLRTSSCVMHGKPKWLLRGEGLEERFSDIADLMACLNGQLQADMEVDPMPAHIARRLAGNRAANELLHAHVIPPRDWKK